MKMMVDLATSTGGAITIGEHRYRDLPDPARTVGAMIESDAFHPGRSGRNHLRVIADATGIAHARVDEMLDQVGLAVWALVPALIGLIAVQRRDIV
jgi:ABC-2 type transport system ATP-binding protein